MHLAHAVVNRTFQCAVCTCLQRIVGSGRSLPNGRTAAARPQATIVNVGALARVTIGDLGGGAAGEMIIVGDISFGLDTHPYNF